MERRELPLTNLKGCSTWKCNSMFPADEELMIRCKKGDMGAFELIVRRYQHQVISYISRVISDQHRAEDLAQETFLRVLNSVNRYQAKGHFKNWLYLIATNLCRNEIRNRKRQSTDVFSDLNLEQDENSTDHIVSTIENLLSDTRYLPDQLYEKKERQQMIRQQVNNLPDNQKLSLILITYQELSYQEVSTIIGCSVSAVKSLVHRARQSLKRKLIELGVEESHNAKI